MENPGFFGSLYVALVLTIQVTFWGLLLVTCVVLLYKQISAIRKERFEKRSN